MCGEGWRASHALSNRATLTGMSAVKDVLPFLISPCAPALKTCASVIELDAVANSIGMSLSNPLSIEHSSSPVPSGRW